MHLLSDICNIVFHPFLLLMSDNSNNKVINPSSCHPPPFHTHHCLLCMVLPLYPFISCYHHTHYIRLKMLICSFDIVILVVCIFPWHSAFLFKVQKRASIDGDNSCSLRQDPQGSSCNSNHQPRMMQWFVILLFHEGRKWSRCTCQEEAAHPCTPAGQAIVIGLCAINYITKTLMRGFSPPILGLPGKKLPFCLPTFCGCSSTHPW